VSQGTTETVREIGAPASPRAWQALWRDPLAVIVRFQSVIGLLLVLVGGVLFSPSRHGQLLFLAPDNVANIVRAISETGIIALGMTFVIITGGIDLSVGAVLGLASVLTQYCSRALASAQSRA
jgi:ribose transport system permease protein